MSDRVILNWPCGCHAVARIGRALLVLVFAMATSAMGLSDTHKPYNPEFSHPTIYRFHKDDSVTRVLMGPFGSGKSVGCVMEIVRRSIMQEPYHGVRRTRWAVVRNTCPELKSTTIKTWKEWTGTRVIMDVPFRTELKINLPDGTRVESEVYFLALDRPEDVKKLMSLDVTGMWLNEARYLPEDVYETCVGRKGRYPSSIMGGPTWCGVFADTNPPDRDHWIYRKAMIEQPNEFAFFKQPGGLIKTVLPNGKVKYLNNPEAENVEHLPNGYKYYHDMTDFDPDYVNVHVLGEWGTVFTGKPVYEHHFSESVHVSDTKIEVYRGLPLLFGWDFGLTPAGIMTQMTPRGELRAIREFVCRDGGLEQFLEREVMPVINQEYPGMKLRAWCDPAGTQRAQTNEVTCIEVLRKFGFEVDPAPTNDFPIRRDAVIKALSRMIDGKPGMSIDRRCEVLVKGFCGAYQFDRVKSSTGSEKYKDVPNKSFESHISEAFQYLCLGVFGQQQEKPLVLPQSHVRVEMGGFL